MHHPDGLGGVPARNDGAPVSAGPLTGVSVIELAGIGPGPFAAMMLADLGADVVRVDRAQSVRPGSVGASGEVTTRGRRSIGLDLKHPDGRETVLDLVASADVLIEGFRPGVTERLGIGPDECLARNPGLIYGRMTGWGQHGPWATTAGHDINYIALAGVLGHVRRAGERPMPPLNLVGDFGGGGMLLAFGVVCGLLEARASGVGQVVDAAMVDGAALLMAMFWGMRGTPAFDEDRPGHNLLDTGAPFYDVYECADGSFVSIGAIEPQFYADLLARLGLADDPVFADQYDRTRWPERKVRLAELFLTRTRSEWCGLLETTDVCFAPVLTMTEAAAHPHNAARATFVEHAGRVQPAPAPRFSRTPGGLDRPGAHPGTHTRQVLAERGLAPARIDALIAAGAAVQA
jgi:alpha-methylacyl-CoA racemase